MNSEERYFATKKAFQTLSGEPLKKRLAEIYTPEIIVELAEQEQKYVDPVKRDILRKELNREYAKNRRDKTRQKNYGPRTTRSY